MRFRFFDRLILFGALRRDGNHSEIHAPCQAMMAAELDREKAFYGCREDVITNHRKITIHR
jgi:hypothetical protein